jgi:hypothetical protein
MSMPLYPDDFDSGTAPMRPVRKAGYNANTYGGFPDNPVVNKRKKLAKAKVPNTNNMTPNPSGSGAKAGTLSGRSYILNIGVKTK